MPKLLLVFTSFFLCATAHAQYGDANHKANQEQINKEQKAYTDAYIDALRKNTNSKTKSGGGADPKAAQELADLFAARAGRETEAQKTARLQKEQQDYQTYLQKKAVADKALADHFAEERERRNLIFQPLYAMYKEAGIPGFEAEYLSNSHIRDYLSFNKEKRIFTYEINESSYRARESFIEFNKKLPTAGFDELFYLITDFNVIAYSALTAMEKLEQRFPEKKALLDAAGLMNTASYWGNSSQTGINQYDASGKQIQEKMLNNFSKWFDKYPEGAMQISLQAYSYHNPLKLLAQQAVEKKDYELAGRISLLSLFQPRMWAKNESRSREFVASFSGALTQAIKKNEDVFTTDDLKRLAEIHDVPPHTIVEWLSIVETGKFCTAGKYGWNYYHPFTISYFEYSHLMKTLGLAGDGNALNMYAIGVAFGKQKEKPKMALEYLKQAAAAGCTWAMYNLLGASGWDFKWYKSADFAAAKELWKTFKPATEYDKYQLKQIEYKIKELLSYNR